MDEKNKIPTPPVKKSSAGKGDKPRNISRKFWDNYDEIDWGHKSKNAQVPSK